MLPSVIGSPGEVGVGPSPSFARHDCVALLSRRHSSADGPQKVAPTDDAAAGADHARPDGAHERSVANGLCSLLSLPASGTLLARDAATATLS